MSFEQSKSSQNKDGFCYDTLYALLKRGPLEAGDIPSKVGLAELIEHDCAVCVIAKGEHAYAATYKGKELFVSYKKASNLREALGL